MWFKGELGYLSTISIENTVGECGRQCEGALGDASNPLRELTGRILHSALV